jgi:hypothetical protein
MLQPDEILLVHISLRFLYAQPSKHSGCKGETEETVVVLQQYGCLVLILTFEDF